MSISLPELSLVVLVRASGSGKSTFAADQKSQEKAKEAEINQLYRHAG